MNKYEFYHNELVEMTIDRTDKMLVEHYTWMSECAKFRDAVDFGEVINKDVIHPEVAVINLFSDFEDFDISTAVLVEEHSMKARHRKHRKSCRMAKVNRRKNSRWVYYFDGTAKECKVKNHRAVRHEYDIPMGKSNFSHKIGTCEYFW